MEPVRDVRELVVRPDRERVPAEPLVVQPLGLAGQAAQREAVAVALGDRDQARVGLGDLAQVAAPALAVDGEDEAHPRPPERRAM